MGFVVEMLFYFFFVIGYNGEYNVMGCGFFVIYINNKKVCDMIELDCIWVNEILFVEVIIIFGVEYVLDVVVVICFCIICWCG